jgi:hypothetical protein
MKWSLEPGTGGRGTWFVGRGEDRVEVIAPPGVPIPAAEQIRGHSSHCAIGWQLASWRRREGKPLNVDRDAPDGGVSVIDTNRVLRVVGTRLQRPARAMLEARLAELQERELGALALDAPDERFYRGVIAATWVRSELAGAFVDVEASV